MFFVTALRKLFYEYAGSRDEFYYVGTMVHVWTLTLTYTDLFPLPLWVSPTNTALLPAPGLQAGWTR